MSGLTSRDRIEALLASGEYSVSELVELAGCSRSTVRRALETSEYSARPGRGRPVRPVDRDAVVRLLHSGRYSAREIAEQVGCSDTWVRRIASTEGIEARSDRHLIEPRLDAEHVKAAIERCGGNVAAAARELGVSPSTVRRYASRQRG